MRKIVFSALIIVASLGLLVPLKVQAAAVSPPEFGSQNYGGLVVVSMVTPTTGAIIRYTTDGADPSASSAVYTVPLSLYSTTTLKARGLQERADDQYREVCHLYGLQRHPGGF
jgi:hypothetical protein